MADEAITLEVIGIEELTDTIDKMIIGLHPDKIEPSLNKGAQIITREVRKRAPVGPTENLKKAVRTKKLKRWFSAPAPSIATIDRKKAPHAWLVTHGTSGVRRVEPPHFTTLGGQRVKITQTGIMPPNRFFGDSVEAKKGEVLAYLEKAVGKLLEEAMK